MKNFQKIILTVFVGVALVGCKKEPLPTVPESVNTQNYQQTNSQSNPVNQAGTGGDCGYLSPYGFPQFYPKQQGTVFLCRDGYALEFNPRSRTPMWVVERLAAANLDEKVAIRENDFRPDPDLSESMGPQLEDYAGSGFDRGHMAPAEDFRKSVKQMSQSFYLTNMVPQNPNHNRGIWAKLEKNTRYWAKQYNFVYVITGPIYYNGVALTAIGQAESVALTGNNQIERSLGDVKKGRIAVPTHLYKVVYAPSTGEAIAFVIPNQPQEVNRLPNFAVTVAQVEQATGLRFFPQLKISAEEERKLRYSIPRWIIN